MIPCEVGSLFNYREQIHVNSQRGVGTQSFLLVDFLSCVLGVESVTIVFFVAHVYFFWGSRTLRRTPGPRTRLVGVHSASHLTTRKRLRIPLMVIGSRVHQIRSGSTYCWKTGPTPLSSTKNVYLAMCVLIFCFQNGQILTLSEAGPRVHRCVFHRRDESPLIVLQNPSRHLVSHPPATLLCPSKHSTLNNLSKNTPVADANRLSLGRRPVDGARRGRPGGGRGNLQAGFLRARG